MIAFLIPLLMWQLEAPPSGGAIRGKVIDAVTSAPVRKAQVSLYGLPTMPVAVTDGTGRFVFSAVPAGIYQLYIVHPDYPGGAGYRPVELGAAEEGKEIVIKLPPAGSLSGRFLDQDGEPLDSCGAQLLRFDYSSGSRRLVPMQIGHTGERGEYRIARVPAGRYFLRAVCDYPMPVAHALTKRNTETPEPEVYYSDVFYPDAPDIAGAAAIRLPAGANLQGLDFQLKPGRRFTIRGHVAGPEQMDPSQPTDLHLVSLDGARYEYNQQMRSATGRFAFAARPHGGYRVEAWRNEGGRRWYGAATVVLADEPPGELLIPMAPAPDLTVAIEFADGEPAPTDMAVSLERKDADSSGWVPAREENGQLRLEGVLPGRWRIRTGFRRSNEETANVYLKSVRLGERDMRPDDFEIPPGANGIARLVLSRKAARVSITVASAENSRQGIVICFRSVDDGYVRSCTGRQAPGTARIGGLAPGEYRFYALPEISELPAGAPLPESLADYSEKVTLSEGEQASVSLRTIPSEALSKAISESE